MKKNTLKKLFLMITNIAGVTGQFISSYIPKNKNIWIFGSRSGKDFADNIQK